VKQKRDRTKKPPPRSRAGSRTRTRSANVRRREVAIDQENSTSGLVQDVAERPGVSPADSGGDVDADWQRAQSDGEETVGGSVATPDQSVVDELARPLGVERQPDAEVIASDEILSARDRRRWRIEQHTEEQARDAGES
jgi:hypothetical protein